MSCFLGGTLITISGTGFSSNPGMVSILIGSQPCAITYLSEEKVLCQTPPAIQLSSSMSYDFSAQLEVFIGNRSSEDTCAMSASKKNFTFLYKTSLTPSITGIGIEMMNGSLWLGIEGVNVTDSVAMLGDVACPLETVNTNQSVISAQCSLPLSTLEPGQFLVRILQKQVGQARIPGSMQHFTVAPLMKTIFPSRGSACGGQLITISGLALKSQANSAWVNVTDNFTCEIQSASKGMIKCALFPSSPLVGEWRFHDASQALNITVTVNGIGSRCLGDCSYHLHENLTPVIEAVTVKLSGILTHLFIKGLRLAWAVDEALIEVDAHFLCNVTFWNETGIECQTDSLDAGEHSLSILSRKWGQACLGRKGSNIFRVAPHVLQFYPQNFSINGKGLLTLEGMALKGRNKTSIFIGSHHCLLISVAYCALKCLVPPGSGIAAVRLEVYDVSYYIGEINYSEDFTPVFLSLPPPANQLLTIRVSHIRQAEDMYILVGGSPCANVTGNCTTLHCVLPQLPAGQYNVTGGDVVRGWASSSLVFTSVLAVVSVNNSIGTYIHSSGWQNLILVLTE